MGFQIDDNNENRKTMTEKKNNARRAHDPFFRWLFAEVKRLERIPDSDSLACEDVATGMLMYI